MSAVDVSVRDSGAAHRHHVALLTLHYTAILYLNRMSSLGAESDHLSVYTAGAVVAMAFPYVYRFICPSVRILH